MTQYIAGFLFDNTERYVVFIHKRHGPPNLVGKWNAVGGKVEPGESALQAMTREFAEETGTTVTGWLSCVTLHGPDWTAEFFRAFAALDRLQSVSSLTDEEVRVVDLGRLPAKPVSNLRWLIPMILHMERDHVVGYEVMERLPEAQGGVQ